MANQSRSETARLRLYQNLGKHPYEFGFYSALRRVENANSDKAKIGYARKPAEDAVRLGQQVSMAFAPSTIASFERNEQFRDRMNVYFFGLFGCNGPMPLHMTEYALNRVKNAQDQSLTHFVDIFHHRLLSMFYRIWADSEPTVNLDRPKEDVFSNKVASFIGLGSETLNHCDAMPDYAKLHFSGHFANANRNAEGLVSILRSYFGVNVELEQYIGNWLIISPPDQLRLGETVLSGSLGETSTLGEKVWECQNKFRLSFGPLELSDYLRLLPGGVSLYRLIAIVRNYLGDEFDWDVQPKLKAGQIKPSSLGVFGQLGWTTWMVDKPPAEDFSQLYLNPLHELL